MIAAALGIFKAAPFWVWAIVVAMAWGGVQRVNATHQATKRAAAEQAAAVHAVAATEQAKARQREAALSEATRKAADAYRSDLARRSAAAAAVRADRDRLLDAVAAAPGACPSGAGASAPSGADGAAALRLVVRECAAAVQALAETADNNAARLKGLQDYVRAIQP